MRACGAMSRDYLSALAPVLAQLAVCRVADHRDAAIALVVISVTGAA